MLFSRRSNNVTSQPAPPRPRFRKAARRRDGVVPRDHRRAGQSLEFEDIGCDDIGQRQGAVAEQLGQGGIDGWINELQPGDDVYLKPLRRPAKVVRMELHKQKALVTAGAMDIEVSLRDIDTLSVED